MTLSKKLLDNYPRLQASTVEKCVDMLKKGKTYNDIREKTGLARATISSIKKEAGIIVQKVRKTSNTPGTKKSKNRVIVKPRAQKSIDETFNSSIFEEKDNDKVKLKVIHLYACKKAGNYTKDQMKKDIIKFLEGL